MAETLTTSRSPRFYGRRHLRTLPQLAGLSQTRREELEAVAHVLPFRVNEYVLDALIDWQAIPDDPIYQLTFPQPGMLEPADLARMVELVRADAPAERLRDAARAIQARLNPHPGAQLRRNVPRLDGQALSGMQHKYRETLLFFPSQGQTCHAYCTYCFRWAQFVGQQELRFASREVESLVRYLRAHPEITDVLFTGGDPLVMKTEVLARYVRPLLEIEHLRTVRVGSKAPAYWPQRFVDDDDAGALLALFEEVVRAGKHLALMAHYSHPRELEPSIAQTALTRIRGTGATVRTQAPLIRHVNDDAQAWAALWRQQVRLGAVPYYLFVERDTGPRHYFEVPLARALEIYQDATRAVSGLARHARGPCMSTTDGKVIVQGVARVAGQRVFVLRTIQARDPDDVGALTFVAYDPEATWIDQLEPAFVPPARAPRASLGS